MNTPYGSAESVDDSGVDVDLTDAGGRAAIWVNIFNRSDSSNSFDVSYDGGATYITRLVPGQGFAIGSLTIGAYDAALVQLSSVRLRCSDVGGTATAEVTCVSR